VTTPRDGYRLTDLRQARLTPSPSALLSVPEAARLLGWNGARDWIRHHVPIYHPDGRERVIWSEVLDAVRGVDEKPRKRFRLAKV
jgi:hypothetical protein